jgi:hypothetical protein
VSAPASNLQIAHFFRDDTTGLQALSALLREQNEKLDLLLKKTDMIGAAREISSKSDSSTTSSKSAEAAIAVLPPRKEPLPLFQTSTSAFFCVNVVDAGVKKLGLDNPHDPLAQTRNAVSIIHGEIVNGESSDISISELDDDVNAAPDGGAGLQRSPSGTIGLDPLDEIDHARLIRALHTYADMEGSMYPILDMANVVQKAKDFMTNSPSHPAHANQFSPPQVLTKEDFAIMKMAAAIGLLPEDDSRHSLALRLFQSVRPGVESMIWNSAVDLKDLVLMALVVCWILFRPEPAPQQPDSAYRRYFTSTAADGDLPGDFRET